MPAFRWWEKDRNAPIVTNHPKDAVEIERRHSDGRGLLHADGASRANILSGDAAHSMLTMSTVLTRRRPIGRDYAAYFARPYATFKTLNAVIAEYFRERCGGDPPEAARRAAADRPRPQVRARPRLGDGRSSSTSRSPPSSATCSPAGRSSTRPSSPTTRSPTTPGSSARTRSRCSTKVDRQIGRIEKATAEAPRPYRLIVLSDHGQSQGATFLQRYGYTPPGAGREGLPLGEHLRRRAATRPRRAPTWAPSLTELDRDQTPVTRAVAGDRREARRRPPAPTRTAPRKAAAGERAARARGDGLGLPRADQLPARARAADPGADRGALPDADRGAPRPRGDRLPARRLRARRRARDRRRRRQPAREGRGPR